eukprot:TRINITY_DN5712_c0_g1_i1.p1 TRINITY_DN5712_c0_g1~~TRINITY_DN5712_c0_g1_i1.p1  ORF type:complete len:432 (-),score=50.24 TRINITY_DN5712_c0_g1_i1:88-1383(-)
MNMNNFEPNSVSIVQSEESFISLPSRQTTIICPQCQLPFVPTEARTYICPKCLSSELDIAQGITKQAVLNFCRECKRYQRPPWISCQLESPELLALCLSKIKGLNRVKLIEANFIWTEPLSRRIKIRLRVSKEELGTTIAEQTLDVEFTIEAAQCDDCRKGNSSQSWLACVQLRQKINHKRTFYYVEQMILKHNIRNKIINAKDTPEGLDFFFKTRTHALQMIEFLKGFVPLRVKASKQVISNAGQSKAIYKNTFMLEIPSICKDDLVFILPIKLSKQLKACSNLLLCTKITSLIHLTDPITLQKVELSAQTFFQHENILRFIPLRENAVEYLVQNIEKPQLGKSNLQNAPKAQASDIEVVRTSDWETFFVKSHLGDILQPGDSVLGFDLTSINLPVFFNEMYLMNFRQDAFLVRKAYPELESKDLSLIHI